MEMSSIAAEAEARRQRIIARGQNRLEKIRQANESERSPDVPPMAPVSIEAPKELFTKKEETKPDQSPSMTTRPVAPPVSPIATATSLVSTISSAANMISSFTSSTTAKTTVENTPEMQTVDQQHLFVILLGLIVSILYSFYLSSESSLFFHVYLLCCLCILASRYVHMQMKHRSNPLISTLMLSGFRPNLVKKLVLVYTLVYDSWILFALYFVSFSLTHVLCSLV